jgi:MFS family permease
MIRPPREPKRTVWLLFLAQALNQSAMTGQVAMAALIGHSLAADKSFATLPMAVQMLATMSVSIPGAVIFGRLGRHAGFLAGAAAFLLATGVFLAALWLGSFPLYLLGCVFSGAAFGIAMYYRFAAAEVAQAEYRPKAISLVMAGGVIGAVLGPAVVKLTKDALAPVLFAGTYLAFAAIPILIALLVSAMRLPPAPHVAGAAPVPLGPILRRPGVIVAILCAVVGWDSMNLLMSVTPLEMMLCGFTVGDSATIIQWHAAAMFAPSFVTGHLIARFGVLRVIGVGALLTGLCAGVALSGASFAHFWVALVLLGIGWNFMFVGATALLTASHTPAERTKAQAANDVIVFGSVAVTSLASGAIHHLFGWAVLNYAVLPALALALAALAWLARRRAAGLPQPA